jgi:hypothetical protein
VSRARRHKALDAGVASDLLRALRTFDGSPAPAHAEHAKHPVTGAALASLRVVADGAA